MDLYSTTTHHAPYDHAERYSDAFWTPGSRVTDGAGQSQETFAEACGIDRTYISGIERGRRNVGLKNIDVIANALGVTLSELFEGV